MSKISPPKFDAAFFDKFPDKDDWRRFRRTLPMLAQDRGERRAGPKRLASKCTACAEHIRAWLDRRAMLVRDDDIHIQVVTMNKDTRCLGCVRRLVAEAGLRECVTVHLGLPKPRLRITTVKIRNGGDTPE